MKLDNLAEAKRLTVNATSIEEINQAVITAKWLENNPQIKSLHTALGDKYYFYYKQGWRVIVQPPVK
tara:strand:+ start:1636 stop:1836 length:201 start_codon:yes stop_codon:yes gene_type:complete